MEFSEKPASGGRPPRDKRHRAEERAKKGAFVYNTASSLKFSVPVRRPNETMRAKVPRFMEI